MEAQPFSEDTVVDNSVRATKWFCTINGPYAANFYTALAVRLGYVDGSSAQEILNDPFVQALNTHASVLTYFKNSDAAIVWELAPTTGHYHLHICLHNRNKLSRRQVMEILGPCDVRTMIAAPHIAHNYLLKSGNIVLYVGDKQYWDAPHQAPTKDPIDFIYVRNKALLCDTYKEFIRKYVTAPEHDEMCLRASLLRASWIQQVIASKSDKKAPTEYPLTQWQHEQRQLALLPPETSHRKIRNIWSTESGTGKSSLADILRNAGLAVFVFPSTFKLHDAIYMYNYEPIIIVDLARHASIEHSGVYEVLEVLSDQRVCSTGKFAGKSVRWLAHIFVLSNQMLDASRLPGRITFVEAKPLNQETYAEIAVSLNFMDE